MDIVWLAGIVITVATAVPVLLQLRKHPKGLFILFFAEMWERFSYYGMRGLLIFYLTQHFLFDDKFAQGQYGSYTSLVYLLPLVGGFLADRFLGTRKAIAFGALLLVAGHFAMGVEGRPATQVLTYQNASYNFQVDGRGADREVKLLVDGKAYDYAATPEGGLRIEGLPQGGALPSVLPADSFEISVENRDSFFTNVFYLALALIIMGVGFLKANISAIVGQLYEKEDPRRDAGFTLYYYGINLGAFWAAIACGWLGQNIGWWAGFGAAGVGMLLGYVVFVLGKPLLQGKGEPPEPEKLRAPVAGPLNREHLIYIGALLGVGVVWVLVQGYALVGYMLGAGSVVVLGYLGWYMATKCTKVERNRLLLALILIAASVVFWTLFEQAGSSLNLFADRHTNLGLPGGQALSPAQTQSFNAGFILLFAPVFSFIWAWLGKRGKDPNPVLKFSLALLQVGLAMMIVVWGANFVDESYRMPLIFLALAYMVQTTGEMCLSPVGLSQMTKLSTAAVVSTLMATWFLASAWAQWIGGFVAGLTSTETIAGQVLDPAKGLATYVGVYSKAGLITIGIGAALLIASPFLKKLAHGLYDHDTSVVEPPVDGDLQAVPPLKG